MSSSNRFVKPLIFTFASVFAVFFILQIGFAIRDSRFNKLLEEITSANSIGSIDVNIREVGGNSSGYNFSIKDSHDIKQIIYYIQSSKVNRSKKEIDSDYYIHLEINLKSHKVVYMLVFFRTNRGFAIFTLSDTKNSGLFAYDNTNSKFWRDLAKKYLKVDLLE